MKTNLINIGFGNAVVAERVIAVITPQSASGKRIREEARDNNLLIDATYADPLREWLGPLLPGSLLILDEAHHAAPASGGRYGIETKFTRAIRDLARSSGKDVALVLRGADVEVDRSVLESLKAPLLHLVRNAVDHGIERPDERQAAGKPVRATVTVSAALRGDRVEVVVADDGRGFDLDRIRAKLRAKGISVPEDERELARLAFLPGISPSALPPVACWPSPPAACAPRASRPVCWGRRRQPR